MAEKDIRIRAHIRLLPTSNGGRAAPVHGGVSYRPNHNFFGPDNLEMAIGFIDLPEGELLLPGEAAEVEMTFWNWVRLTPEICPGREWIIQEGPKVVGVGTVLQVLD